MHYRTPGVQYNTDCTLTNLHRDFRDTHAVRRWNRTIRINKTIVGVRSPHLAVMPVGLWNWKISDELFHLKQPETKSINCPIFAYRAPAFEILSIKETVFEE